MSTLRSPARCKQPLKRRYATEVQHVLSVAKRWLLGNVGKNRTGIPFSARP